MRYTINTITPPVGYPVEREDMMRFLKMDTSNPAFSSEGAFIEDLIAAATSMLESYTGRTFMTQTLEMVMVPDIEPISTLHGLTYRYESLPRLFKIRRPPCQSVTGVYVIDQTGASHTQSTSYYTTNLYADPAEIALNYEGNWEDYSWGEYYQEYFKVRYVAGYGDTIDTIPPQIRQAIRLTVAQWYASREALDYTIPTQAVDLLQNLKIESWDL